ncbi:uncharacterized protein B0I36DRAFT_117330 [Microdochium trichocladiopsis]|uniref:Uncharacterized protein n=1 Tax=Microdochium trichocladiopsis TaxID=1682393 RepID=A0A9P8Y965_9PEZI|nr:uncharacterized protein B0I36DRAFT_117330 [Microdochium trichocladiopsis]KAH7030990.1 hypothetical protein B0I36DRAFT_117330 [Microdochium trichocladiopsis]
MPSLMAYNWDNPKLPRYIEVVLGLMLSDVTKKCRPARSAWADKRSAEVDDHDHKHQVLVVQFGMSWYSHSTSVLCNSR